MELEAHSDSSDITFRQQYFNVSHLALALRYDLEIEYAREMKSLKELPRNLRHKKVKSPYSSLIIVFFPDNDNIRPKVRLILNPVRGGM